MGGLGSGEEIAMRGKRSRSRGPLPCTTRRFTNEERRPLGATAGALSTGRHVSAHKTSVVGDVPHEDAADRDNGVGSLIGC